MGLGYSTAAVRRAATGGRLHRIHRGVYAVGHILKSPHTDCMAAVLACGQGALASHSTAAWLWGIAPRLATPVHVSLSTTGHARRPFRTHHAPAIQEDDRAECEHIPVTAVPRTLLDLAAASPSDRLVRAIERSEQLGLFDLDAVDAVLARTAGHHGRTDCDVPLGLPLPSANFFIAGYELDMYWPERRFAVELDGYEYHRTRAAFERDRVRQEDLKLAGIEMTRVTAARLAREPTVVVDRIRRLLAQRR
jgi:hypothetical protein